MIRLFLDASVLISAIISAKGASRELFNLAGRGLVELVTNRDAVIETERNLRNKAPETVPLFEAAMASAVITIYPHPTDENVKKANAYTVTKDAPIVAGAIESEADYLVTFDRKHLINPPEVAEKSGLMIDTAGNVLQAVREKLDLQ